jgi:hypothetical protein
VHRDQGKLKNPSILKMSLNCPWKTLVETLVDILAIFDFVFVPLFQGFFAHIRIKLEYRNQLGALCRWF